ncbi:MAG TPA: hypothetical protein VKA27_05600 [Sunxiuqinia sp.]|nr:hypothetical protein [Sunxiuqinia sp.]
MKKSFSVFFNSKINIVIMFIMLSGCTNATKKTTINADLKNPEIQFAVDNIRKALSEKGIELQATKDKSADIVFSLQPNKQGINDEGFSLNKVGDKRVEIVATGYSGAMYGGLELAEQIKSYGLRGVKETTQNPYMKMRGTKFNIPLDARTPSYSDMSDVAQQNIPVVWDMDFWKGYIDRLAEDRYNFISLWSLNPFPSMVRTPGYEDIALDNVLRSTGKFKDHYPLKGKNFDGPEILDHTEVVVKITMDEKIKFWREVMKYAKDRNINFYIITWNIYDYGINGKHGITTDQQNDSTRDYFRKSVKAMLMTYPDLAGFGLTTGENMNPMDPKGAEKWAFETYGQGMLDAAAAMPDRKFRLIHRQHWTKAEEVKSSFAPVIKNKNIDLIFCYKYAGAHAYSCTKQNFCEDFVNDIKPAGMKTIWTVRNDDDYMFRWGAPDFVREFIKNFPEEVSKGYQIGSDQWVWGRDFISKDPDVLGTLEIQKHWYSFMLWGRLGYNPDLSDDQITQIIHNRFPKTDAHKLFAAWQAASMTYPVTTGFHFFGHDMQWYIEGCMSEPRAARNKSGFHDVERFMSSDPHPLSGYQSIYDFVEMTKEGGTTDLKTPFEVAKILHQNSDKAMQLQKELQGTDDPELKRTLTDIQLMALLGKYYALKIEAATNLSLYQDTKDKKYQEASVSELTTAFDVWKRYSGLAQEHYINPIWMNRVRTFDWDRLTEEAKKDINNAKND